jgi:hypothetical protein
VGRGFLGSNLTKKFWGGQVAVFGCFAGVFEGGAWKIVAFFDGNLLVSLW